MTKGYNAGDSNPEDDIQIIDRNEKNTKKEDIDTIDNLNHKLDSKTKYPDSIFDNENLQFMDDPSSIEPTGLTPLLQPVNEYLYQPNNQLILNNNIAGGGSVNMSHPNASGVMRNTANAGGNLKYNFSNMSPLSEPTSLPNLQPYTIPIPQEPKKITNGANVANAKRRRENNAPKTRPAFVMKVWSMVNDEKNNQYIRWNSDGKTFQVYHREEFMKEILPKYFKHNNFASFVRQLNMYGWHKVQDITTGTLKDDKNLEEIWQFKNPNFIRGHEELLDKIIRNKSMPDEEQASNTNTLQLILNELDQIKMNQIAVNEDLKRIRIDNKTLWQENYLTRERHQQQAQTLDKILKFLATVYGNKQQFIDEQQDNPYASPEFSTSPFMKPRLMLMDQEFKSPGESSPPGTGNRPQPVGHRQSNGSSIEEIMRSYGNTPKDPSQDLGKMFQQMVNNGNFDNRSSNANHASNARFSMPRGMSNIDTTGNNTTINNPNNAASSGNIGNIPNHLGQEIAQSPRHYFPELNMPPGTSEQPYLRIGTPDIYANNELLNGIEQNVAKQGQSMQQVQDWIQKLAQQQKNNNTTNTTTSHNTSHNTSGDSAAGVGNRGQANQGNSNANRGSSGNNFAPSPNLDEFDVNEFLRQDNQTVIPDNDKKRPIEEIHDEGNEYKKRRNQ